MLFPVFIGSYEMVKESSKLREDCTWKQNQTCAEKYMEILEIESVHYQRWKVRTRDRGKTMRTIINVTNTSSKLNKFRNVKLRNVPIKSGLI